MVIRAIPLLVLQDNYTEALNVIVPAGFTWPVELPIIRSMISVETHALRLERLPSVKSYSTVINCANDDARKGRRLHYLFPFRSNVRSPSVG